MSARSDLRGRTVVAAGGTGNVGAFLVEGLLEAGARVAVPSRSGEKTESLRRHLREKRPDLDLDRLHTVIGDLGDERRGPSILEAIEAAAGPPDAAIAALGRFQPIRSLASASAARLRDCLDDYLMAHFNVARTLLPGLAERDGRYVFVNGPLAFQPSKEAALVSIATAAQQMMFRCLAKEFENSETCISELVTYAFVRDRRTQPSSALPGEAVGRCAARLLSAPAKSLHGGTFHLDSMDALDRFSAL